MTVNSKETLQNCIDALERIINDDSVPRNIRRNAENIRYILSNDKETPSTRAAMVISNLDEMGNDPNVPIHTRTLIWGLSSQLESIPVDE
ncbi:MAG: UPF0147 family protein [Candidatus Methanoperedens sp.]|nr:UPF0147 family protein [Candidatus Methanoperedens sp.]